MAPEIAEHGKTGFLRRGEKEMISAVGHLSQIRRTDCRAAAEQRFSIQRMALDHERLYRQILFGRPGLAGQPRAGTLRGGDRLDQISA